MLRSAMPFLLSIALLAMPHTASAQTATASETSTGALIETAGAHLDSMLVAMNQRNFDETAQALKLTGQAVDYAEQMGDALDQLAGHGTATDPTVFMQAETTADQITALLRIQERALRNDQRALYASARVDIRHLLGELPIERVFGADGETSLGDWRAVQENRPRQ